MTASIDFPAGLPLPLRSGYDLNHASPLMRTGLQSGRARQRRRYTTAPSLATVSWVFSQSDAQAFEAWFRWSLKDGSEWFNITLRTPMGLKPYECRFSGVYSGPQQVGVDRWQVQATLELRDRPTLGAGIADDQGMALNGLLTPAAIDYPAGLPHPLRSGYELEHESPLLRSEIQTGRAQQRRRYTSVPSLASVGWTLTQAQAQTFEAWFRHNLADGTQWFNAVLDSPLGLMPYVCRFSDMYTGPTLAGVDRWQIRAKLEIRERPTLPSGFDAVPSLVLHADIFDRAINREWPI